MKIAFATIGHKQLDDVIADTFSRAPTFTILTVEDGRIEDVETITNSASKAVQGSGPLAIKQLNDKGVNVLYASAFGLGAETILNTLDISMKKCESGIKVKEAFQADN